MKDFGNSVQQVTLDTLTVMKQRGEKIAVLTCYDASFTRELESAGVEVLLVGDSLGNVIQGHDTTLPVSMDDMVYHASCVARAGRSALRVVDLPYQSYRDQAETVKNARRLVEEGGAHLVKLEGGNDQLDNIRALVASGIPVCGHLGLLPQSVESLGGYFVQGKDPESAQRIFDEASALEQAGVGMLVIECVPAALATRISEALEIPVIGIGAGSDCDGQVLVVYDMLGLGGGKMPRFVRNFLVGADGVNDAARRYVGAVKSGEFPDLSESY